MKLEQITQFNPALIYGFDPEGSFYFSNPRSVTYLHHSAGQYQDMFNAYLYAQEVILSTIIKEGLQNITADRLIEWLNQLHLRIAATVAKDFKLPAGEFSKQQVFHWYQGSKIQLILIEFLSGTLSTAEELAYLIHELDLMSEVRDKFIHLLNSQKKSDTNEISDKLTVITLLEAIGMGKDVADKFLRLMLRVCEDPSIEVPKEYLSYPANSVRIRGYLTFEKLAVQYHSDKLTVEEKSIVDEVVRICTSPRKNHQAMKDFAEELLIAWKKCDHRDIDQVTQLVYTAFPGITKIHPYFNCNGRLATCLANIILISLGKPSILIRNPNERDDPNSSYSQAIANINKTPELLFQHLKNRIKEAEINGGYCDVTLKEIILARVEMNDIILAIVKKFPGYDINKFYVNMLNEGTKQIGELKENSSYDENKRALHGLRYSVKSLQNLFNALSQQQVQKEKLQASVAITRQYSDKEIHAIIKKLEVLTGESGWAAYKTNGLTILLTLNNETMARQLVTALCGTNAMHAVLKWTAESQKPKKPVVLLNLINPEKLEEVQSLSKVMNSEKATEKLVIEQISSLKP